MKQLKVLLTSAPTIDMEAFDKNLNQIKGYVLYPPISLTTLAGSVLKNVDDVQIEILDLEFHIMRYFKKNQESELQARELMKKIIVSKIDEFKPDVVGISVLFSRSHSNLFAIANIVKEKNSSIQVVTGGNHATFAYKKILKECLNVDLVFLYEGDTTFPSYLEYLKGNTKFEDLKGIAVLDKITKESKISQYAPLIENLDSIPIPAWNLVPLKEYQNYGRMGPMQRYGNENLPTYAMQTVRGCVASCTFCSVRSFYGKGVRAISTERFLSEIDYLYNVLGIKQLQIVDDDFTFNKERTFEICNGLIKRNYDLIWNLENGIRLGTLNDEVIHALVAAKCRGIYVGVESGNDKTLALCRKPLSVNMLYRKAELLRKYPELYVTGNYMVGFAWENNDEMMNTFKVAEEIGFDWNNFAVVQPLPGTPLFQDMNKYEQENFDFDAIITSPFQTYSKEPVTGLLPAPSLEGYKNGATHKIKHHIEEEMGEVLMNPNSHEHNIKSDVTSKVSLAKDLEINFLKNKNLNGRNVDRAIRDYKGILRFVEKDHAIAHYCLAKAYKYKNDTRSARYHMQKVFGILIDPVKKKRAKSEKYWVEYFDDLVPREELNGLFSFSNIKNLQHNISGIFTELQNK